MVRHGNKQKKKKKGRTVVGHGNKN